METKRDRLMKVIIDAKKYSDYRHLLERGGIVITQGENPKVGSPVFGLSEDKESRFPAPMGVLELDDGRGLIVDGNSLFKGWLSRKAMKARQKIVLASKRIYK